MTEKINKLISGKINGEQLSRNALDKVSHYDKSQISTQWFQVIDKLNKYS